VLCKYRREGGAVSERERQWLDNRGILDAAAGDGDAQPERISGREVAGRSHEIQRLIGRSLRAVADMSKLGKRTLIVDCDVIQAMGNQNSFDHRGLVALHWRCKR